MTTNKETTVCEMCEGTGEVSQSAQVYPGEPHTADIETAPCPECQLGDQDDYQEEE